MIPKMLLLLFIISDWCTMITNSPCSRLWKEKVARRYSRRRARSQGGRSEGGRGGTKEGQEEALMVPSNFQPSCSAP